VLLSRWKSDSPEVRARVMSAFISQRNRVPVLLDALEEHQVELASVEINVRNRLLEESDPSCLSGLGSSFSTRVVNAPKRSRLIATLFSSRATPSAAGKFSTTIVRAATCPAGKAAASDRICPEST
jgi:hypothetical protein